MKFVKYLLLKQLIKYWFWNRLPTFWQSIRLEIAIPYWIFLDVKFIFNFQFQSQKQRTTEMPLYQVKNVCILYLSSITHLW